MGTYDATLTFTDKTVIKVKLQVKDIKRLELQDLINRTNELIAECGTITPNEPSAMVLTASQLSDNWGEQEGSLSNLLDGNSGTYYVSNWGNNPNTAHYIQIDLGDGNELEQAIITFSARKGGGAPTPTKITISYSTDGTTFNDVQTFTQAADGLPAAASGEKWTSPVISVNQAARYWRFTVLECTRDGNNKGTNSQGIYHFGIGDLGVLKPNGYTVNVNSTGNQVTEELLLNTYLEVLKAENLLNSTATIEQIETEIESLQAKYDALYEALHSEPISTFDGIYIIKHKRDSSEQEPAVSEADVFVGFHDNSLDYGGNKGFKLIAEGTYTANSVADKYFTIKPTNDGFMLSVQGKYLKAPETSTWNHLLFSDDAGEAGDYLFEKVENDVFNVRSIEEWGQIYLNHYADGLIGNNQPETSPRSTFTFTKVDSYPITISDATMATLCLPFNVVMPDGMNAYDFAASDITPTTKTDVYDCRMQVIAAPGETLKSGTPVILHATPGAYALPIQYDANVEAKTKLQSSLLRGNFIAQKLTQSDEDIKFIFTKGGSGVGFYRMQDAGGTIAGNKCWMVWNVQTMPTNVKALRISFDQTTGIDNVPITEQAKAPAIYDLAGRKLTSPQRGFNIVNGKKVIIK